MEHTADTVQTHKLDLLRNKRFRLLYGGYLASALTDGLIPIAFTIEVLRVSDSTWALSSVLIALWAGNVAVVPLSGRLAAMHNPLQVMACADGLRILAQGGLIAVVVLSGDSVWAMTTSAFLFGAGSGIYRPAQQTALPALIAPTMLGKANASFSAATDVSLIAGPALGLAAINVFGFVGVLTVDCVTFAINIFALQRLATLCRAEGCMLGGADAIVGHWGANPCGDVRTRPGTLRTAWSVATNDRFLGSSLLFWMAASVLIGMIAVYAPIRVIAQFGDARAWAAISTVMAVSSLVGSVTAALGSKATYRAGIVVVAVLLILQISLLLRGFDGEGAVFYIACAAFGAGALMTTWSGIRWTTAVQQRLSRGDLGRFSAVETTLTGIGVPVGMALGPVLTFGLAGWLVVAVAVATLFGAHAVFRHSGREHYATT
jgi:hypothetical protein